MNERERSQKILDVMFEAMSRVHARDRVPEGREECMSWVRSQLIKCGIEVYPLGICHVVLAQDPFEFMLIRFPHTNAESH